MRLLGIIPEQAFMRSLPLRAGLGTYCWALGVRSVRRLLLYFRIKLLLKDSNYTRTVRTWVKKEGQLTPVEKQQRILPWWRVNADGSYVLFVRSGSKAIEFEKGKNAIAVPSLEKVPMVIDILITAVRNGELDVQLAQAKKPLRAIKSRNAA